MREGEKYVLTYTVQPEDLANKIAINESDAFPRVLSTSRMIDLMEVAAARLMAALVDDGNFSVGVYLNISHMAPTLCQEEVSVVATFKRMEGGLYWFDLELHDACGKAGAGTHMRTIVNAERFTEAAKARSASVSSDFGFELH